MTRRKAIYTIDDIRVDVGSETVSKAGRDLTLEPKAFKLLVFLIENRERLIEKKELLEAIWEDTFVTENALTRLVAQLRKTLGDEAKEARYIRTVPTRGYRFVGEVRMEGDEIPKQRVGSSPRLVFLGAVALVGAAGLSFFFFGDDTDDASRRVGNFLGPAQLTSSSGLDVFPELSPDGSAIAYSSNRSGSFEIYVKQLAPGGAEIQLTSDGGHSLQPAWSPDGREIVYYSMKRSGLWSVPSFGGVTRRLTDFGSRPAWSPDGKWIAFQSQGFTDFGLAAYEAMPPSIIWICSSAGGAPSPVTKPGEPPGGHGAPTWSPDGERIVFTAFDFGMTRLWSVTRDGGGTKRLLADLPLFSLGARYGPDEALYLTAVTERGQYGLWRVPALTPSGGPGGEPELLLNPAPAVIRYPTISATGGKLAYTALTMTSNLASVRVSPDTSGPLGAPTLVTRDASERNHYPFFSPDGGRIVFKRAFSGARSDVWLVGANGDGLRQLTAAPLDAGLPQWFPDGRRLAFTSKREGRFGLWSLDLETGNVAFVRPFEDNWSYWELSPDGTRIAFNAREAETVNIWTAPLDGGPAQLLTSDREFMGFPAWSADARRIALQFKRGEDTQVGIVPADGGAVSQLTHETGQSWVGSWSPDGDKIAFSGLRDGSWNLWWVSRSTGEQKRLTDYEDLANFVRYPTWSPRGDQIVYEYAENKGNIWLVELP